MMPETLSNADEICIYRYVKVLLELSAYSVTVILYKKYFVGKILSGLLLRTHWLGLLILSATAISTHCSTVITRDV